MRIALVSDPYAPRLGGIETQVKGLAETLAARGHEVLVVTATPAEGRLTGSRDIVAGVRTLRLASPFLGDVPISPLSGPQLERAMRGADVVHIHTGLVSPFAWHAACIAARLRLPTLMTWHCVLDPWAPAFRLSGFPAWLARRGVQHNSVSRMAAALVQRAVGEAGRVGVLHNGVDLSAWRAVASRRAARTGADESGRGSGAVSRDEAVARTRGPLRIVSARRLAPRKRSLALAETVERARRVSGVEATLTIYGDGPLRRPLQALADERGWDWLRLPGRRTPEQLREAYLDADIYLSLSRRESFGIATIEGRAAGLPVVCPAGTGADDFLTDGEDGLLGGDDVDVAAQLARLLADDDLRARITRHNERIAPEEGWDTVAEQTERAYARVRRAAGREADGRS